MSGRETIGDLVHGLGAAAVARTSVTVRSNFTPPVQLKAPGASPEEAEPTTDGTTPVGPVASLVLRLVRPAVEVRLGPELPPASFAPWGQPNPAGWLVVAGVLVVGVVGVVAFLRR